MSADPVELIAGLSTSANVSKSDFVAYEKTNIRDFANADEVRNSRLSGRWIIFVRSTAAFYRKNSSSTAEDDGESYIYDYSGNVWQAMGTSPAQIAFRAHKNGTDQTGVTASTPVKVTFGTAAANDGDFYDPSTGRFTPPIGWYYLNVSLYYSAGVVDQARYGFYIYKNGGQERLYLETWSGTNVVTAQAGILVYSDGSDYFEVYALAEGSGAKTISGVTSVTYYEGFKVNADQGLPGEDGRGLDFDARGDFAGLGAFDDEPQDFAYLSMDGDGDTITDAVMFFKNSAASGDWSDPVLVRGPIGTTGDAGISGTSAMTRVRVVATSNVAIATALENGDALDGATLVTNDSVLLTAQSTTHENGVWVVQASGAAVRHTDFDTYDELPGTYFSVMEGTAKADTLWRCTSNRGGTIGSTAVVISEFTAGGNGTFAVRGANCLNNASTPNTQFDMDADEIVLRNSAGATVLRIDPGAAITCNISTSGPAANGRDQSGALSSNSWAHFYWIWNGTTLATTVSATAPPTGPTLPSGYTHWAYAGPVRIDGSGNLLRVRIKGNRAYYGTQDVARPSVLTSGSATTETAVDVSTVVPPNATDFEVSPNLVSAVADGSGVLSVAVATRVYTGINYYGITLQMSGLANSSTLRLDQPGKYLFPNVGQQFYYLWIVTTGSSPAFSCTLFSYGIPNGGA